MRTLHSFKERGISLLTIGGLYEEIIESEVIFILYVSSILNINRRITFV